MTEGPDVYLPTVFEQPSAPEPVTRDNFLDDSSGGSRHLNPDEVVTAFTAGEAHPADAVDR